MSTNFGTDFAFTGGALPTSLTFVGSVQQQLEDAEVRCAQLELELAAALDAMRIALVDVDKAKAIARNALNQLRTLGAPSLQQDMAARSSADNSSTYSKVTELEEKIELLVEKDQANAKVIEQYEGDLIHKAEAFKEQSSELSKAKEELNRVKQQLEDTRKAHEGELERQHADNEKLARANKELQRNVEDHKANATHNESILNRAYANQENLHAAYNALTRTKDDAEAQTLDLQMRYDSLYEQWQEDRNKIDELEGRVEMAITLEESVENFKADLADRDEQIRQYPHMLLVKDERIADLELQLQKERAHNINAADAAAKAVVDSVISNDNEAPPALKDIGSSLADELSDHWDDEYDIFPHEVPANTLSPVSEIDTTPIAPSGQSLSIGQSESVSVAPIAIPSQSLSIAASKEYFSVSPIDVPTQRLSTGASEYFNISPVDVPVQRLSTGASEYFSISPVDIVVPHTTLSVIDEINNISPVEIATPALSFSINETGSVTPIERPLNVTSASAQTDLQDLTVEIVDVASIDLTPIAPVVLASTTTATQTETPQLTSGMVDAASVAVQPTVPARNYAFAPITTMHESAPIEALPPTTSTRGMSSITVTNDQTPIEVCSPTPATTTTGVQTTDASVPGDQTDLIEELTRDNEDKGRIIEDLTRNTEDQPHSSEEELYTVEDQSYGSGHVNHYIRNAKYSLDNLVKALPAIVTFLLFYVAFYQAMKIKAWETANGYTSSSGNSYDRGGAYGNGRHLFGLVPLGQDIGGYWWTEQIANIASRAVTGYERWAGVDYPATY